MRLSSILTAGVAIGLVQPSHVGQRVEEEVRLDLRLQDLQARLVHLAVEREPVDLGPVHRLDAASSRRWNSPTIVGGNTAGIARQHRHRERRDPQTVAERLIVCPRQVDVAHEACRRRCEQGNGGGQ